MLSTLVKSPLLAGLPCPYTYKELVKLDDLWGSVSWDTVRFLTEGCFLPWGAWLLNYSFRQRQGVWSGCQGLGTMGGIEGFLHSVWDFLAGPICWNRCLSMTVRIPRVWKVLSQQRRIYWEQEKADPGRTPVPICGECGRAEVILAECVKLINSSGSCPSWCYWKTPSPLHSHLPQG